MGKDQEPVRKTKKVWAAEPENVTPPPPIAPPVPRENLKPEERKSPAARVAAPPFRDREEWHPQVNRNVGGPIVDQPKPKEDAAAAARSRVRPLVSSETSNGGDGAPVGRRSTRAQARVNAIAEKKVSDRDEPHIHLKAPTWRPEDGLHDPQAVEQEGRDSGGAAKERSPVAGLTAAAAPPPQKAVKERTLHSIPPPYVKTVVGPKAERHQPPSPPPEKPGRKEDVDDKEEAHAVHGERLKPRSVRRKPPPPAVAAAGEEAALPARHHHERRRIFVGAGEDDLDEEEHVEQLLIH